MYYKFGLKLWSTNTDYYFDEAKRLYADGAFLYVELFVVPDTLSTIPQWKTLGIPIGLHCPHFLHGFNLADCEKAGCNRKIYDQVKQFADELDAEYIVFHGGIDGKIEETARQLKAFDEPRAVIENKPYKPRPEIDGLRCRGATVGEIKYILDKVGCGFCLDIGHAVCSANSQRMDKWEYLKEFSKLNPIVHHLTDLYEINSEFDSHAHIGQGQMDIVKALSFVGNGSMVTIETEKSNEQNLKDWEEDIRYLKNLL